MSEQPQGMEQEVRETVRSRVQSGFSTRENIVEDVPDYFIDDYPDLDTALVERIVDEEFKCHAQAQAGWEGPTDCDRLDLAFAQLERTGIVARQNFSCCGNCGTAEIGDEATEPTTQGYVFYHMQDTERAVEGRGLYFNYGTFEGDEADALTVGHRLVEALHSVGLEPQWNGDLSQRVHLPLTWRKRHSLEA